MDLDTRFSLLPKLQKGSELFKIKKAKEIFDHARAIQRVNRMYRHS